MSQVMLICGKICSGKTYYAKQLKDERHAAVLSVDEATHDLIGNEQGDFYELFSLRVKRYLRKMAVEIVRAGTDVILDWGFWTSKDRTEISDYLEQNNVRYEWHYVDVNEATWKRQIEERNARIAGGNGGSDFYLDEGLAKKLLSLFEAPSQEEIDVWHFSD